MCYFNCQGCTTVTTRSLTIFGGNSLIYPSLAHVTSRCVPTNTIKLHPKDNKKQNVFLKGEILEKQKPGCREAKSNVPQKETAMTWFFCFGPFKIAPELCWKVAKQKLTQTARCRCRNSTRKWVNYPWSYTSPNPNCLMFLWLEIFPDFLYDIHFGLFASWCHSSSDNRNLNDIHHLKNHWTLL